MKKLFTVIIFFSFYFELIAQNTSTNSVLLLPLSDNTTVSINGNLMRVDSAIILNESVSFSVLEGKICLIDNSGEEVLYKQGEKKTANMNRKEFINKHTYQNKLKKLVNNPSQYLPNLYNDNRGYPAIYPQITNVTVKTKIKLRVLQDKNYKTVEFKLFDRYESSLLSSYKGNISDINVLFEKIKLNEGESYVWKLYDGTNSSKGSITVLNEAKTSQFFKLQKISKLNYLHLFFLYLEKECFIDALNVMVEAHEKFPESETFNLIIQKILYY